MTDLSHVSFVTAIRETAAKLGRTPVPEQIEALDKELKLSVQIDHEGHPVVGIEPVGDFIGRQIAAFPTMESMQGSTTLPAGTKGALDRIEADADAGILRVGSGVQQGRPRGDPFADIVRGLEARHQVVLAAEASGWPNPWLDGQINRTHQTIISRTDPARAARMKAEAGA